MPDFADPLIQGLMAGIKFKQYFANARRQQEELQMRKEQIAEARTQRQRQNELADLQQRIAMGTNPDLSRLAPGQTTRPVSFPEQDMGAQSVAIPPAPDMGDETLPGGLEAPPSIAARFEVPRSIRMTPSGAGGLPVENPIEYRGDRYDIHGPEEIFNRNLQTAAALAEMKRRETEAGYVPITGSGQTFRVPPQVAGTQWKALNPPPPKPTPPAKPGPVQWFTDKNGNVTGLERTPTGLNVLSGPETQGIGRPPGTAGGTGSLAAERFEFGKRETIRKEQEAEDAKQEANVQKLIGEAEKHHGERVARGQELASGDLDKKKRSEIQAQFSAATQRAQDVQYRIAKLMRVAAPPKTRVDAMRAQAEAEKKDVSWTAPDGGVWNMSGGILYIVDKTTPTQATQPTQPRPTATGKSTNPYR